MLTLDTETYRFYPGNMTPKIVCGSWANDKDAGILLRDGVLDLFEQTLNSSEEICGAHIAYDFGCVAAARPHLLPLIFKAYDENRVFDILVAEALYDIFYGQIFRDPNTHQPFERYSQGMLEERLLGIDRSDEKNGENSWRRRYGELDGVPFAQWPAEARGYPVRDARYAHECATRQKQRPENLHSVPEQVRAAWALHLASVWGIRTDPATVEQVAAEIETGHTAALARFAAIGFFRPDGSKDTAKLAQAVALAYGGEGTCDTCGGSGKVPSAKTKKPVNCGTCGATGLNISSVPTTPTGRVLCDRDALQESGDEQLESFAEIGENEKWYSTYLPLIRLGAVVPINAETNVLVATGRTSYRKPNLQNLPRRGRIRETFVPRVGWVLYTVDYGGLELVTLAQTCLWWVGSSKMAEALNAGEDLHAKFGAALLNMPILDFLKLLKARDKVAINFRQLAKPANFGFPGGLGADRFVGFARQSYGAKLCELAGRAEKCGVEKVHGRDGKPLCSACRRVAKEMREQWFVQWPEVGQYHEIVASFCDGPLGGRIEVCGAEPFPGPGLTRGGVGFCDGANLGFQGNAARGAKHALYNVTRESYIDRSSVLYGSRPLIFVHDEIIGEAREDRAHEVAHRVSEIMIETMRIYTPDVRVTAPPALMPRWYKGADPVYRCPVHTEKKPDDRCCPAARLVPWTPPPPKRKE